MNYRVPPSKHYPTMVERLMPLLQDVEGTLAWGVAAREGEVGQPRIVDTTTALYNEGNLLGEVKTFTEGVKVGGPIIESYAGRNFWGRKHHHTQGRDIRLHWQKGFVDSDFWVRPVSYNDIKQEWRIHIFNGKVIARGFKIHPNVPLTDGGTFWDGPNYALHQWFPNITHMLYSQEASPRVLRELWNQLKPVFIRNRRTGWVLDHTVEPPKGVRAAAKLAVEHVGYLFGAVDLLACHSFGGPMITVLEVNTAPGMDNYTAGQYAKAIRQYVQGG